MPGRNVERARAHADQPQRSTPEPQAGFDPAHRGLDRQEATLRVRNVRTDHRAGSFSSLDPTLRLACRIFSSPAATADRLSAFFHAADEIFRLAHRSPCIIFIDHFISSFDRLVQNAGASIGGLKSCVFTTEYRGSGIDRSVSPTDRWPPGIGRSIARGHRSVLTTAPPDGPRPFYALGIPSLLRRGFGRQRMTQLAMPIGRRRPWLTKISCS